MAVSYVAVVLWLTLVWLGPKWLWLCGCLLRGCGSMPIFCVALLHGDCPVAVSCMVVHSNGAVIL